VRAEPRKPRKPREARPAAEDSGEIDIAALPPAIGKASSAEPAKKLTPRPRRKRTDDSEASEAVG